ncbi:MAG TPA: hypothetical protein VNW47_00530 [Terriglobales bacterium]|nr:hypothetical protein [Terriglobales bacterium]
MLAPKPIVAIPLRHRGGLSFTAARDQRSQVLAMYTQNAIKRAQTMISPRRLVVMSRIGCGSPAPNAQNYDGWEG